MSEPLQKRRRLSPGSCVRLWEEAACLITTHGKVPRGDVGVSPVWEDARHKCVSIQKPTREQLRRRLVLLCHVVTPTLSRCISSVSAL